ncbi:hypothetical protein [Actinophytocola sp. KF-1]
MPELMAALAEQAAANRPPDIPDIPAPAPEPDLPVPTPAPVP